MDFRATILRFASLFAIGMLLYAGFQSTTAQTPIDRSNDAVEIIEPLRFDFEACESSVLPEEEVEEWHRFAEAWRPVPLTDDEQQMLFDACEEFQVDYFLMLGLIERETNFRNVHGDSGESAGYCQVQRKWWGKLMRDIGATDLTEPQDNFRTACAIIRHLFGVYGDGECESVLTAYNTGHGGTSAYARAVMKNQEKWEAMNDR